MPLNMSRVAFGCDSLVQLRDRIAANAANGEVRLTTRYLPKRHAEMADGSLFWIMKHALVARSPLIGFMDNGEGRTWIRIKPEAILVRSLPKRAHQGWRYLEDADAPKDLGHGECQNDHMPPKLIGELMRMGLV